MFWSRFETLYWALTFLLYHGFIEVFDVAFKHFVGITILVNLTWTAWKIRVARSSMAWVFRH